MCPVSGGLLNSRHLVEEVPIKFLRSKVIMCYINLSLPFEGCQFKTAYGMKDMERHLKIHTGTSHFFGTCALNTCSVLRAGGPDQSDTGRDIEPQCIRQTNKNKMLFLNVLWAENA